MAEISIQRLNWRQWPEMAPTWERIHGGCPEASFFVSREWVDCWLASFGQQLNPELLLFARAGEPVGCCFLVWRTRWISGIPLRKVYPNCSGENESDSTCLEFNALVTLPGHAAGVAEALAGYLRRRYWDELVLDGAVDQEAIRVLEAALGDKMGSNEVKEVPSRFVDLSRLRDRRIDFLNHVSAKTRYHIRRSQRAYEEVAGPCTVQVARNVEEGLAMLRQLADLHQSRWEGRGKAGAFSSATFQGFHERLLRQCFDRVLLIHLRAGTETIGLLQCFLHREWVYFYQSGFSYSLDSRRSPGLLTLYHLIKHCIEQTGLMGFDFMAGDVEYKRSLSAAADYQTLKWILIRRNTPSNRLYLSLRRVKRKYVEFRQKSRQGNQPPDRDQPASGIPVPNAEAGQRDGNTEP